MGRVGKGKYLDNRAKEVILDRMREQGEMTTTEIMDLVRPHFMFDVSEAREQAVRRQANRLVRSLRDESGVRTCFNLRGQDMYINIEKCNKSNQVRAVEDQLNKQISGLQHSRNKAARRRQELEGQLQLMDGTG